MSDDNKNLTLIVATFSKDNPIIEISSKQSTVQTQNITPPVKPKETKKERGD